MVNVILKSINISPERKEAQMTILHTEGDTRDSDNYDPINLLYHTYKLSLWISQKQMEKTHDEKQPREQAVSGKVTRQLIIFKQSIN